MKHYNVSIEDNGAMIEHSSLNKLYCIKTSLNKQYGVKND